MINLRRALHLVAGLLCIGGGAVLLPLPTPVGIPLLIVGLGLLVVASRAFRRAVRRLRSMNHTLDGTMSRIEPWLPGFIRRAIRVTRPWKGARRQPHPPPGAAPNRRTAPKRAGSMAGVRPGSD